MLKNETWNLFKISMDNSYCQYVFVYNIKKQEAIIESTLGQLLQGFSFYSSDT